MISRNCRIALLSACLTLLLCGGALAASLTIHAPEEAKQGSAVKVRVVIDEQLPQLTFTWLGKHIAAPTVADGAHRIAEALLHLPVNTDKDLIVQATAGTLTGKATVKVLKVKWPEQKISVKKTFVNPPKESMKRINAERKKSGEALNRVTPERYWRGEFQRPVPGVVTSAFGGRRMFNGELRSYHRGVDLRGAEGTPIKAMADGKVVIAASICNHCGRCVGKCPFKAVEAHQDGYRVYIGGRWGKKVAQGKYLDKVFTTKEEVLNVVEKAILLFREQGNTGERFADTVARLGFENVQEQLLSNQLLERKQENLSAQKHMKGGATC